VKTHTEIVNISRWRYRNRLLLLSSLLSHKCIKINAEQWMRTTFQIRNYTLYCGSILCEQEVEKTNTPTTDVLRGTRNTIPLAEYLTNLRNDGNCQLLKRIKATVKNRDSFGNCTTTSSATFTSSGSVGLCERTALMIRRSEVIIEPKGRVLNALTNAR